MRVRVIPCRVRIVVPVLSRVLVARPLVVLNVAKAVALARLPLSPTGGRSLSTSFAARLPAVGTDRAMVKADMQALVVVVPTWTPGADHPGMAGAQAR